ncbi:hypothetical protein CTheo_6990 [Ceratobasidium theobromae]|uniref:Ubiquitin-like domain-containing protein n=1 Tax=Ceratobasidium theobromae TaxID=1582974 RepID=A0A5N5QD26_9AGAM|nr:hypothetical protein CTheo_6990 [Ceratobasidium theobromae]
MYESSWDGGAHPVRSSGSSKSKAVDLDRLLDGMRGVNTGGKRKRGKGRESKAKKHKGAPNDARCEPPSELQQLVRSKLQGSRFRMINETLYKSSSEEAHAMMRREPEMYAETSDGGVAGESGGHDMQLVEVAAGAECSGRPGMRRCAAGEAAMGGGGGHMHAGAAAWERVGRGHRGRVRVQSEPDEHQLDQLCARGMACAADGGSVCGGRGGEPGARCKRVLPGDGGCWVRGGGRETTTMENEMRHINVLHTATRGPLTVAVPANARVADLKTAIAARCPGQPRPHGQRIIWRGRIVVDDEVVGDIWDTHTVHLAVHPSAWSAPRDPMAFPTPLPTLPSIARDYVLFHHKNALRVMAGEPIEPWPHPIDQPSAVHWASLGLAAAGHPFPSILLSPYPHSARGGLEYAVVSIDHRPYLELLNPGAPPTAMQHHAIQVLTSTLALLPYLDDLGPAPHPPPRPPVHRMRRALVAIRTLVPLSFTLLRASLFIVFFPQAREPLWLAVIIAVVLYEARLIVNRANALIPNLNPPNTSIATLLDRATLTRVDAEAALLDLDVPERQLRPVPRDPAEESHLRRSLLGARAFVLLLAVTLVPAAWARRREALRLREGRVRVVYGDRANSLREHDQQAMLGERRTRALPAHGWRRSYVQRVLNGIEEHVE